MKNIAIYGAGGHAKVVIDTARFINDISIDIFDENNDICLFESFVVKGNLSFLCHNISQYDGVIVAIGDNTKRMIIAAELKALGAKFATIIHPSAVISEYAEIMTGTVIFAGAIVNASAKIGEHCIINTGATVDHDCDIASGVHLSPGVNLAGGVQIGEESWIGIGTVVKERVQIGSNVLIGAGSVVVDSIPSHVKAYGVPAKIRGNQC